MKVLRATMYGPDLEPMTIVVRETDIMVPIEVAVEQQRVMPGGYVVCDVFELEDNGRPADIIRATLEAQRRQSEVDEDERNAAMLYHWDASHLRGCAEGGVLTGTMPAPLTVDVIRSVFEQLAHHPLYRHQLVIAFAEDGTPVRMRDGEVHAGS